MSVFDLMRDELRSTKPFKPSPPMDGIRLHANELPWERKACAGFALNHYPNEKNEDKVLKLLAKNYQISPSQLVLTRGSDDGLDWLMRVFLSPGKNSVLQCPPTFSMYAFYAKLQQAKVINCALEEKNGFKLSVEKLFSLWEPDCKIVILCQPNNPTGTLLPLETIADICHYFQNKALVLVDEAYIEFADIPSSTSLLPSFENLVILRTLSKAQGLAGLRLGAVIAQSQLIDALKSIMPPYLLSSPVLSLATSVFSEESPLRNSCQKIIASRNALLKKLEKSPWISAVFPSQGNFILVKSPFAAEIAAWFSKNNLAVRSFGQDIELQCMLRITVGSETENARLLDLLDNYGQNL